MVDALSETLEEAATVEVSYRCEFSADKRFGGDGTVFIGAASRATPGSPTESSDQWGRSLECELPVMGMASSTVFVRLRFAQAPRAFDLAALTQAGHFSEYTFTGVNPVALRVIPRPFLSSVLPLTIFNLAAVEQLEVTGERFENAGSSLKCQLYGASPTPTAYTRTATFVSRNQVTCPVALPAVLSRANTLTLSVSNDGGDTWSQNSLEIHVPSQLPRITSQALPRLIFAGQTADLVFQGSGLSGLGPSVLLRLTPLPPGPGDSASLAETTLTCYAAAEGASLACPGAMLPSCDLTAGCGFGLTLIAEKDADWGGSLRQPATVTVLPRPQVVGLSPNRSNSAREQVQILFADDQVIETILERDAANDCCLDAALGGCQSQCLVKCTISTPGRQEESVAPMVLDGSGKPSCNLPTFQNSPFSCSDEVPFLEVEITIDSYVEVESLAPRFGCLQDTTIEAPTASHAVLYQQASRPFEVRRIPINGTNFRVDLPAEEARCLVYDPEGAAVLSLPVDFRPVVNLGQVHCLISSARDQLGTLRAGTMYSVRFHQSGVESLVSYPLLVLVQPRILGVSSRLLSHKDDILLFGSDFSDLVEYFCQYVPHGLTAEEERAYQTHAPATYIDPWALTCPSYEDAPTYLSEEPQAGFQCFEVRLIDRATGVTVRAEAGSPA